MFLAVIALALLGSPQVDSLRAAIESRIAQSPGIEVGVAYVDLEKSDTIYIHADSVFHAASTMKVPVMLELYRRAAAGGIRMDQGLLVVNQFASIVDGSPYSQDPKEDSDSSMYLLVGTRVRIDSLIRHMITRSSNLATNTLITLAGPDQVNATLRTLGISGMKVLRGVEDLKAFDKGLNNTATARDLATLLVAIETGMAADPVATAAMRDILLAQEFNGKIPAGLPPGTRVAHKTGEITGNSHDAAIVYPPGLKPYALVVLTRGAKTPADANALIADISRLVWTRAAAAASHL